MRCLCPSAPEDRKLFGLVEVEDESVIEDFRKRAGIGTGILVHKILRVLDAATAGPEGMEKPG